jgi:hypothetical protein
MRFVVMVKGNKDSEAGVLPSEQELIEMGKFNDKLIAAGVMRAGEGLRESAKGAKIRFTPDGRKSIIDGPFAEAKELIAGFWIVQAKSLAETVAIFSDAPFKEGELEIRQIFESADFEPVIKTDEGRAMLAAEDEFRKGSTTA